MNEYHPDHVPPPGDSLLDVLAERLGLDAEMLHRIIVERDPLTRDDAAQLEAALGTPATFWRERERRYRVYLEEARRSGVAVEHLKQAARLLGAPHSDNGGGS